MANPRDVLAQLLSNQQADALSSIADSSWAAITRVLSVLMDAAPAIDGADGRLVMPDEIVNDYTGRHLVVPIEMTTAQEQNATAYAIFPTESIAAFFDSAGGDEEAEEQQTIAVGSTIANQLIQGLNSHVFGDSPVGLALNLGEITANTMIATLEAMDEPALALALTLSGAQSLSLSLVLPGTFLDIMAGALPANLASTATAAAATLDRSFNVPGTATQDGESGVFPPIRAERASELVGAAAGMRTQATVSDGHGFEAQSNAGMGDLPPRAPTPISNAPTAQRARFAPLPDADPPASRGNMELLSSLQMNVTVELGRTELTVAEVLGLGPGSVVELDRLAGEPVDILVNDRIIARGEVVVVDENFGVRVVEVVRRGVESEERAG